MRCATSAWEVLTEAWTWLREFVVDDAPGVWRLIEGVATATVAVAGVIGAVLLLRNLLAERRAHRETWIHIEPRPVAANGICATEVTIGPWLGATWYDSRVSIQGGEFGLHRVDLCKCPEPSDWKCAETFAAGHAARRQGLMDANDQWSFEVRFACESQKPSWLVVTWTRVTPILRLRRGSAIAVPIPPTENGGRAREMMRLDKKFMRLDYRWRSAERRLRETSFPRLDG